MIWHSCVPLIRQLLRLVAMLGSRKPIKPHQLCNYHCQNDRPRSVCNRCVIEVFGCVFVLSRCFLDFNVGVAAFVIGLSQISSFFSVAWPHTVTPSIDKTFTSSWPKQAHWTLFPTLTVLPDSGSFHRTLQQVFLANNGRLLLRTRSLVSFWDLHLL